MRKLKMWVVEQVLWAEQNMKGKSGKEKRDAVVEKLDAMLKLPAYLEPFDGPIIGFFVDLAVSKLNAFAGHGFGTAALTGAQEEEIAGSMEVPAAMAAGLEGTVVEEVS